MIIVVNGVRFDVVTESERAADIARSTLLRFRREYVKLLHSNGFEAYRMWHIGMTLIILFKNLCHLLIQAFIKTAFSLRIFL